MKMRKGFTLVELLIVIIIIGILAAAMLLSSGSATNSALASAALSEMRGLKAAVVTTIGEMGGGVGKTEAEIKDAIKITEMAKRMEKPDVVTDKYTIEYVGSTGVVSIEPVTDKVGGPEVIAKLKSNAALDPATGGMAFPILIIK